MFYALTGAAGTCSTDGVYLVQFHFNPPRISTGLPSFRTLPFQTSTPYALPWFNSGPRSLTDVTL